MIRRCFTHYGVKRMEKIHKYTNENCTSIVYHIFNDLSSLFLLIYDIFSRQKGTNTMPIILNGNAFMTWSDIEKELFTQEEIAECETRVQQLATTILKQQTEISTTETALPCCSNSTGET